jgi:hypothetical protein
MARLNIWADWRPTPQPFEDGAIEHERHELLQCSAKPWRLLDCRDYHGCSACNGFGTARGETCRSCLGTGVGKIAEGSALFCDCCAGSGRDGDSRLEIRPGELPRREPRPKALPKPTPVLKIARPDDEPAESQPKRRGRPEGSKDKKPRKRSLAH